MACKMFLLIIPIFLTIQQLNAECEELTDHRNYHLLNLGSTCGHGYLNKENSRIMSGMNAGVGVLPWMALVEIQKEQEGGQVWNMTCGGTLINERYVLTAAQCYYHEARVVRGRCARLAVQCGRLMKCAERDMLWDRITPDPQLLGGRTKVYLGMYRRNKPSGGCELDRCSPPVQEVQVSDAILHSAFDPVKLQNDIALLRLKEPVTFTEFIQPVCLPLSCNVRNTDYSGTLMTVAGWGFTSPLPAGKESDALQSLEVLVVASQRVLKTNTLILFVASTRCADYWGDIELNSDAVICAGGRVVGSTCTKDSGSPLMTQNIHNGGLQYFQIGIVSRGQCENTAVRTKPGIYTKIGHYMLWILDNVEGEF